MTRGTRLVTAPWLGAVLVLCLGLGVLPGRPAAAAASCTDTPAVGYTVRVCLDVTLDGPLSGTVDVRAHVDLVDVTSGAPSVLKVVFRLGDHYLLTDHYPDPATGEYAMAWRTGRSSVASGPFTVRARLRDGSAAEHTVPVTIADSGSVGPSPATFAPRTGTAPAAGARLRLAAVGDAVAGSDVERRLAALVAGEAPNLLAYLGDVYERGSAYEYDNWYADPQGFGRFRDITDPTVGNHEYLTAGAAGYVDFWGQVPHYYSVDVAGWHLVSLDSSEELDQLRPGTAQYDWLSADLAATTSRCTLVFAHHPRFDLSEGRGRSGLSAVWRLLAARHVTLALAGHAHHYERWLPMDGGGAPDAAGVTELVAGAGGHELAPPAAADSRVAATVADQPGALLLDLGPDDAQLRYLTVDGAERDAATVPCRSTGDNMPPTVPAAVQVSPVSARSAHLRWSPSSDAASTVTGYTVRRDGAVVAEVPAGTTAYLDGALRPRRTYSWTVDAVDTSGNHSAPSRAVATTTPPAVPARISSRKLLRGLRVAREAGRPRTAAFGGWTDADRNGCDTRREVLLAEATRAPTLRASCWVVGGRWRSPYDGVSTDDPSRLRVWRLVPLAEAWRSGASRWTARARHRFANDLGYRLSLGAVPAPVLAARGAKEPDDWLPPRAASRCGYLAGWVAVKWRWRLSVDPRERRFLQRRLAECGWPRVDRPARARG